MRAISIFFVLFLVLFSFVGCTQNDDLGAILQPQEDKIIVATDTFHIVTEQVIVDNIPSKIKIDTLLLGSFLDNRFGRTKAEILAQFNFPYGYQFEDDILPDSLILAITYKGYAGYASSPLEISAYRMNLETLNQRTTYYSNISPSLYTDNSILLTQKPVVIQSGTSTIRLNLGTSLLNEFVNAPADIYKNESLFSSFFKGLYLTTQYGNSLMLYVSQMNIYLYYHYISPTTGSIITPPAVTFPASKEVRQVNRFVHSYDEEHIPIKDSIEYIKAPAGIFTKMIMPLQRMKDKVTTTIDGKKLNVNSALVNVQVTELDTTVLKLPKYMLLIKESKLADFFKYNHLPDDSTAILTSYNSISNSYVFNMRTYFSNEFKKSAMNEKDELLLVPVAVTYTSSGYISEVEHDTKLHATTIRSGKNEYSPLRIRFVYSGF